MAEKLEHIDEGTLLKYLQGQLSTDDKAAVDELLRENSFYAEALDGLRELNDTLKMQQMIKLQHEKIANRSGLKSNARVVWLKSVARFAAAAVLLLAVGTGIYIAVQTTTQKKDTLAVLSEAENVEESNNPANAGNASEKNMPAETSENLTEAEAVADESVLQESNGKDAVMKTVEEQPDKNIPVAESKNEMAVEDLKPAKNLNGDAFTWYANSQSFKNADTVVLAYRKTDARSKTKTTEKPETGSISGKIYDADTRQPISGVNILTDDNTSLSSTGGSFSMPLAKGKNEITFFAPGYMEESKKIYVNDNENKEYTVYLKRSNDIASGSTVPASSSSYSYDDVATIDKAPATDISNANSNFAQGNYSTAAIQYEDVLRTEPESKEALLNCGISYYNTGNYAKANQKLEQALKTGADASKTKLYLAKTFLKKGNKPQAQKYLQEVVDGKSSYSPEAQKLLDGL